MFISYIYRRNSGRSNSKDWLELGLSKRIIKFQRSDKSKEKDFGSLGAVNCAKANVRKTKDR